LQYAKLYFIMEKIFCHAHIDFGMISLILKYIFYF